jgi:2-iminobutanoate/2-iminopropanoate deaminase
MNTAPEPSIVTLVSPEGIYRPASYAHAACAGDLVFIAGQVERDAAGRIGAPGDIAGQLRQVYANLGAVLAATGCRPQDVVRVTTYLIDARDGPAASEARLAFFGDHRLPHAGLVIAALGSPELRVEVTALAHGRR